jgi:hypothetical protein
MSGGLKSFAGDSHAHNSQEDGGAAGREAVQPVEKSTSILAEVTTVSEDELENAEGNPAVVAVLAEVRTPTTTPAATPTGSELRVLQEQLQAMRQQVRIQSQHLAEQTENAVTRSSSALVGGKEKDPYNESAYASANDDEDETRVLASASEAGV